MNKDIIDIINQAILTEADTPPVETKPEAALDDSKTAQEKVPAGKNPTYILRYLMYLERITRFSDAAIIKSANKISVALARTLKPLSLKPGPNKYNFAAPNEDEGSFYEMLRWEVKDDLKYRMYTVDKMKSDNLEGQATDKVLGSLLGGVKLPTIDYAAQIKYNPEYLQQYNRLLGFLTKAIVENNKSIALHNKETGTEVKDAAKEVEATTKEQEATAKEQEAKPQQAQVAYAGSPKQLPYAGVPQKGIENKKTQTPAVAYDKAEQKNVAMQGNAKGIGYSPETKTFGAANVPQVSKQKQLGAVNASADFGAVIDDILFEKELNATGTITSKVAGTVAHGVTNTANATRLPGMISGLRNLPGQVMSMFTPGLYNVIGYDFGYIQGKRMTNPKVFKKMQIKNVSSLLQFIENSHVYEDTSGKVKGTSAGQKGDMHQIKPTKFIMYRLPKADMFKDVSDNDILDPDKPMDPEELKKLDNAQITDVLKLMPMGTLAVAFWGRIIKLDEITNSEAGKKSIPNDLLLTAKARPEWYFFIPATNKKINEKPIEAAKKEAEKPQPSASTSKEVTVVPGAEAEEAVNSGAIVIKPSGALTPVEKEKAKELVKANPEAVAAQALKMSPNMDPELMTAVGTKDKNQIKTAYRKLAIKYHPDKNNAPEAIKQFDQLQKDAELLKNAALMDSYNAFKLLMKHLLG